MSNMYKRIKNDPRLTKKRNPVTRGFFQRFKDIFLSRGTNPWKVNLTKKRIPWARILAPILIVSIPMSVLLSVDNVLMRLPDVYKYHLLSNNILGERMVAADESKVAQLISNFLVHKTNQFQMKENLAYMPADVFTKADGKMMEHVRALLDMQAIVGLGMLLVTIILIVFLLRQKERDLLLQSFYFSLPVFALMKIVDAMLMMFNPLRNRVFGIPAPSTNGKGDLIPALLNGTFFRLLTIAEVGVSLVALGLVYYIILNLSGRKTTFRR